MRLREEKKTREKEERQKGEEEAEEREKFSSLPGIIAMQSGRCLPKNTSSESNFGFLTASIGCQQILSCASILGKLKLTAFRLPERRNETKRVKMKENESNI